jgi:hypothetical protein
VIREQFVYYKKDLASGSSAQRASVIADTALAQILHSCSPKVSSLGEGTRFPHQYMGVSVGSSLQVILFNITGQRASNFPPVYAGVKAWLSTQG